MYTPTYQNINTHRGYKRGSVKYMTDETIEIPTTASFLKIVYIIAT
jgi:hypothetical protein